MTRVLTGAGLACTRDWVSSLRLSGKRWGHKGRYTLGDKLQWQIIPCVQVGRLVAATCYGDTSEQQLALCVLEKFLWKSLSLQQNYVAATSHTNSVWFDFLQHVAATKFSSTQEAIYRHNVSSRHVAATCHLVCSDLKTLTCLFFTCSSFRFLIWILIFDSF